MRIEKIGAALEYRGQIYIVAGFRPYVRKDGSEMEMAELRTMCPECGAEFIVSVLRNLAAFKPRRRCDEHKAPLRRVNVRKAKRMSSMWL